MPSILRNPSAAWPQMVSRPIASTFSSRARHFCRALSSLRMSAYSAISTACFWLTEKCSFGSARKSAISFRPPSKSSFSRKEFASVTMPTPSFIVKCASHPRISSVTLALNFSHSSS